MNNLFLHILTPHSLKSIDMCHRYGHFNACGLVDQVLKVTPKPIDWIYTRCSQYWVCVFYDRQIQICSLVT